MLPAVQRAATPTMAAQTRPGYPGGTLVPPGVVPGAHEGHPIGPDGAAEPSVAAASARQRPRSRRPEVKAEDSVQARRRWQHCLREWPWRTNFSETAPRERR
jgi:hypothetical protein